MIVDVLLGPASSKSWFVKHLAKQTCPRAHIAVKLRAGVGLAEFRGSPLGTGYCTVLRRCLARWPLNFRILVDSPCTPPDLGTGIMMIDESKLPAPPFRIVLVSALEDLDAADTTVGSKKVASIVLDRDFP